MMCDKEMTLEASVKGGSQTDVKSAGWENKICDTVDQERMKPLQELALICGPCILMKDLGLLTAQLTSIHSCHILGPWVVSASKSGTMLPRRRTCLSSALLSITKHVTHT